MIGPGVTVPGVHVVPDSITVIVGTATGDVTNVQTWQDGNVLQIDEVAEAPGQNVEFDFINVTSIRRVAFSMYYDGSITHFIEIQLFNFNTTAWQTLWTLTTELGLKYRYMDLPIRGDNFIDGGNAKMRFIHPTMGNAADDSFTDYAALIS